MRVSRLFAVAILGYLMLLVAAAPAAAQETDENSVDTQSATDSANATDPQNDGLQVASTTTYAPDPDLEQIGVTATYTMTNLQADEVIGDSVRSFYYTKWVLALPATVTDFAATSQGQPLLTTIDRDTNDGNPDSVDVVFGTINLPFNLNYQQSVQLDVTYTIPGAEPRTGGSVARVNDSFLSFSVWAAGDPGRTDVRILIPSGFRVDLQGDLDELREETLADGDRVLAAIGIQEPRDFFGQVFGRNDAGLLTATAPLPDAIATIRAWPDDPEWVEFVADAIEDGVPVIEDLTGLDWSAGDIEVIETVTPYLFGYGGWFNASSGVIEIGDGLERELILHELGHAWFNDELIDGRWITEGLAEEFASRAIAEMGGEQLNPTEPDLQDPLRVPLAAWASPWTLDEEDAFGYEQYHYNASWWVLRQITNDIGLDTFSEVLLALRNDDLPYPGDGPLEQTEQSTRWTHMFDLLEERGATNLDTLFRNYVLTEVDIERLSSRQVARADYAEVIEAGGEWSPPLVLRQAMTLWRFDTAHELMEISAGIIEQRDAANELATELDVMVEHGGEMLYETATTIAELRQVQAGEDQLLTDLESVRDARRDLVAQATALNTTVAFAAMSYEETVADMDAQHLAITKVADLRGQVATAASALDLREPAWPTATGPTDFVAAAALAEARLATLSAISDATAAAQAPRSIVDKIGLFRTNPGDTLDQARAAYEADELDQALLATSTVQMTIDQAGTTGQRRLLWLAAIVTLMIIATTVISLWQRRRATPLPSTIDPQPVK